MRPPVGVFIHFEQNWSVMV